MTEAPKPASDQRPIAESLSFMYNDLGARLANDNSNAAVVMSSAGVLLGLLATAAVTDKGPLTIEAKVAMSIGCGTLSLSMLFGFYALLLARDVKRFMPFKRWLLGEDGCRALAATGQMFTDYKARKYLTIIHTAHFLDRGVGPEARRRYALDIRDVFEDDMIDYLFFLARMIEVKKGPRRISAFLLFVGGASVAATLLFMIW
jgi:hypothetical protein